MYKMTTEEFVKKAKEIHGDRYDYSLVEYTNCSTKVRIMCKEHGVFEQKPTRHLMNRGCRKCGLEKTSIYRFNNSNTLEFIKKSIEIHGKKYLYEDVCYTDNKTSVKIYCNECKEHFLLPPNKHLSGRGCQKCGRNNIGKKLKSNINDFIHKAINIHGNKYRYDKTIYVDSITPVEIYCNTCEKYFKQKPNNHLNGLGCFECGNNSHRLTLNEFLVKSSKIHNNKYDYSKVIYKDTKTKVHIICPIHGSFSQSPNKHLSGRGCPKCNTSKGENSVRNFLLDNNIVFTEQKTFQKCKYIKKLKFDFYLPDYNTIIEYDGEQHYKPFTFSSDKSKETKQKNLELQQMKDKIKTDYCLNNNVKLIRIPYWDKDKIEEILTKEIYN